MMKNIYLLTLCLISICLAQKTEAQGTRYLDEVFDDVEVTSDVVYGVNATVLLLPIVGEAVPQMLLMDVYQPAGDTLDERPLVLYFHTGNFLPHPQNSQPTGTKTDSTAVEICTRLAKMGFVAASVDYRLGWNPLATTRDERVFTLINAAYRGVQDARTCIRYFRKEADESGNPFKVDTDRIVLWGQGTGGYIPLNTASLDDYNKILTATGGKFITTDGMGNPIPMIIPQINGDIYGTSVGISPGDPLPFPAGDTLNYINHEGYSSDFNLSVNMGGAIGDSAWIDPGHVPMISFHVPTDPSAPYVEGLVLVPVNPPLEVVTVQGSYLISGLANDYGNNQVFVDASIDDPVSQVANSRNDGHEGLLPLIGTIPFDSAPWDWWSEDNPNHLIGLMTNPDMSREKAMRYIDSIMAYAAPRVCVALELGGCKTASVEVLDARDFNLEVYPNPAVNTVNIHMPEGEKIEYIEVYNQMGSSLVRTERVNNSFHQLDASTMPPGIYFMKIKLEEGIISARLVVN